VADYLVEMTTDGKVVWEWRTCISILERSLTAVRTTAPNGPLQRGHRAAGWRPAGQLPNNFASRANGAPVASLEARRAAPSDNTRPRCPNGNILVFDNAAPAR